MKLITSILSMWALTISSLCPQGISTPDQSQSSLSFDESWLSQIDGGISLPAATNKVNPGLGFGGDVNVGYRMSKTLSFYFDIGNYQFTVPPAPGGTKAILDFIPLLGVLRLSLGAGLFHPYVFAGAGIAMNSYDPITPPGSPAKFNGPEADLYLAPGLGIIYRFSSDIAVFLQSTVGLDFTSPKGLGAPLPDPSVFIPLQVGISLFPS